jgi:hypothetical protein
MPVSYDIATIEFDRANLLSSHKQHEHEVGYNRSIHVAIRWTTHLTGRIHFAVERPCST